MKAAALVLLGLAACGGGGSFRVSHEAVASLVEPGSLGDGILAYTQAHRGGPTTVEIDASLLSNTQRLHAVLVHELVHVTGYFDHLDDPSCFLYASPETPWFHDPCDQELAIMRDADGAFDVFVEDFELYGPVNEAASFWNFWIGADTFSVAYTGP